MLPICFTLKITRSLFLKDPSYYDIWERSLINIRADYNQSLSCYLSKSSYGIDTMECIGVESKPKQVPLEVPE